MSELRNNFGSILNETISICEMDFFYQSVRKTKNRTVYFGGKEILLYFISWR